MSNTILTEIEPAFAAGELSELAGRFTKRSR